MSPPHGEKGIRAQPLPGPCAILQVGRKTRDPCFMLSLNCELPEDK
jgi:hypothetical protein